MALPTTAAPSRPAPTPQPRPLASAWVVLEAMVPVRARVARARAAILVLIDMGNSIRFGAARCGPHAQLDGGLSNPVRMAVWKYGFVVYFLAITNSYNENQIVGPAESVARSN